MSCTCDHMDKHQSSTKIEEQYCLKSEQKISASQLVAYVLLMQAEHELCAAELPISLAE